MRYIIAIVITVSIAIISCSKADDFDICDKVNPPINELDCYSVTNQFTVEGYKCCYIEGKADGVEVKACLKILNSESGLNVLKQTVKNIIDSKISIHCFSLYLINTSIILYSLLL